MSTGVTKLFHPEGGARRLLELGEQTSLVQEHRELFRPPDRTSVGRRGLNQVGYRS